MKQKKVYLLIHVTLWLVVFGFMLLLQLKNQQHSYTTYFTVSESVLTSLWFLSNFYLFYYFLIPGVLSKNRYFNFVITTILFLIISPLVISYVLIINKLIFSIPSSYKLTAWGFLGGIFGFVISGGTGASVRVIIDWFEQKKNKAELENKNLESELKLLKARLNPHFLFNTINNIDTLIEESPKKASELLAKLSDLLRYVIYDTEDELIALSTDLEIIEKYIELQKIRISRPENIHLNISRDEHNHKVPPMLFLPLIENAFKYSDLNKPDQSINLEIKSLKSSIGFICRNSYTLNEKEEGVGLNLIRRRLELYYPGSFKLDIKNNGIVFEVYLMIYPDENKMHNN